MNNMFGILKFFGCIIALTCTNYTDATQAPSLVTVTEEISRIGFKQVDPCLQGVDIRERSPQTLRYQAERYNRSLTEDFVTRDRMPETDVPKTLWFAPKYGRWGPKAKSFPAPHIPEWACPSTWKRDRIVEVAKHYTGLEYKNKNGLRGHFPARGCGLDCSNFVAWVYNYGLGVHISSDVNLLWQNNYGKMLAPNALLMKGDLIFFNGKPKHVVIYFDEYHVIDSTSSKPEGVGVRDIRRPENRRYIANTTNKRFLGVKRLIE